MDAAGTTYDIGTGLSDLTKDCKNDKRSSETDAGKVNPASKDSKTPNLSIDPMFLKKGNVIYHGAGGDGTESLADLSAPATDTFPAKKVLPDYTYPH